MKKIASIVAAVSGLLLATAQASAVTIVLNGTDGHAANASSNPAVAQFNDGNLILNGNLGTSSLTWFTTVPTDGAAGSYSGVVSGVCGGSVDFVSLSGRLVSYNTIGNVTQIGAFGPDPCTTSANQSVTTALSAVSVQVNGSLQIQTRLGALNSGSFVRVGTYRVSH